MSNVTQVAFQLSDEQLAEIDELVAAREFRSRAEALRAAVLAFLRQRREERIDAQLEAGYAAVPQGPEDDAWVEASRAGLRAANLDW
ncbi:MAG: ribbon-helix-helix domain-containing protein [Pseudonocardia sp.]